MSIQEPADGWRTAYEKERKKSRIAGLVAAAAAVIAVVALVWGVAQNNSSATNAGGQGSAGQGRQFPGNGGPGGGPGQGVPGQGGPGRIADELLNADGSINADAVAALKARAAEGNGPPLAMFAQILPREVQQGSLTQAQADQILAALGLSGASSGASPSASAAGA